MSLKSLSEVLAKANAENYAVGAFNTNNLETTQAIIRAATSQNAPAIIETSQGAINYAGMENLVCIIRVAANQTNIPVVLHLDHGTDLKIVKKAIDSGYTSVMFDGSHFPFEKNVELTKQVVKLAHAKGISVEGELGTIGGAEDAIASRKIILTDPEKAREFVQLTGVDALAVAIGTSHGAYKFNRADQQIDIKRLTEIKKLVHVPLVLHGASIVLPELVEQIRKFGGLMPRGQGLALNELRRAVNHGINKVNTDTDLRLAFTAALRQTMMTEQKAFDPRKLLAPSTQLMQKVAAERIRLLGSAGKG